MNDNDSNNYEWRKFVVSHLGDFARLWLWVVGVQTVDNTSEKLVETFTTDASDAAADRPDDGKLKQTLQPQRDLPSHPAQA